MGGESRGTLRARLALLYASLFLGSGVVLLIFADLPLLTFGNAVRAAGHGGQPGAAGHVRSTTNLPEVLLYSGIALAGLAVVSVALGWVVADRALRPLRAITAAARVTSASNLSASNLDERLRLSESYEEFRELGDTLDELFARLEAAFESQRHFVANASHELRTPLAAERTVIQVALADPDASAEWLRSACQQLLALGKQQERLIDALLTLASSQRGLHEWEPFDLAEVAGRVVLARSEEAARRAVHVDARLAPAIVTGDPHLAESLIANLVDNAIRHNVAGGEVTIATAAASLSVSNTGVVIPPGEVDRLFEPFQQLAGERTRHDGGHGLGLAIVASIARAHDAVVTARAGPEGGLEITVRFPAESPPDPAAWLVAGADWPAVGYHAIGDDEQFAGQVDHRADVVGHHADEVANPQRCLQPRHHRVFLAQRGDRRLGRLEDQAVAGQPGRAVAGQRLGAGVEYHRTSSRRGDDAGRDDEGDVVDRHSGQVHLLPVAEHIRARPHLRQRRRQPGGSRGSGAPAEHRLSVDELRHSGTGRRQRHPLFFGDVPDGRRRAVRMARVGESANRLEAKFSAGTS